MVDDLGMVVLKAVHRFFNTPPSGVCPGLSDSSNTYNKAKVTMGDEVIEYLKLSPCSLLDHLFWVKVVSMSWATPQRGSRGQSLKLPTNP